jgi:hypothetical protein
VAKSTAAIAGVTTLKGETDAPGGSGEIQTAQEKVAEALALLSRIDGIKTTAGQDQEERRSRNRPQSD